MRTATTVEASGAGGWRETLDYVVEAEKLGLDICWVAEAWRSDAPSPLGYLAARTDRLLLGSGVIQIGTRTPVAIATAALTLAELSGNRFLLGLGPSGPQVIEGLHGTTFDRPLSRMRETIAIIRRAFAGEKIVFAGREFQIPRPGGERKPMRLSIAANPDIPIYVASMSPKMLELTGAAALTSAKAPRSRSCAMTTRSLRMSRRGRRNSPSASAAWVPGARTSATTSTAAKGGPRWPRWSAIVGRQGTGTALPR